MPGSISRHLEEQRFSAVRTAFAFAFSFFKRLPSVAIKKDPLSGDQNGLLFLLMSVINMAAKVSLVKGRWRPLRAIGFILAPGGSAYILPNFVQC